MKKDPYFLSREALYIKVWETPAVNLTKEFGVSDVAITKMCRRLEIPKPPKGYWRRIETGFKKTIPPLPKPGEKVQYGVWIYPKSEEKTLEFKEEFRKQQILEEKIADTLEDIKLIDIKVSASLYKPHALILQTKEAFSGNHTNRYGVLSGGRNAKHLDLSVSKKNFNRALRIMDALVKTVEKCGFNVSIENEYKTVTFIKSDKIKIKIALKEELKRRERELTSEQKEKSYYDRYYYEETGNFTLTLESDAPTLNWRDGKSKTIEYQMNDILLGVIRSVEICRQKEIERKDEKRISLEAAIKDEKNKILLKREQDLLESVEKISNDWRKAQKILEFLKSFENKLIADKGEIDPESSTAQFVNWLRDNIAKIDQWATGQMNELIGKFERREDDPEEDESYEYDDLLWKLKFLDEDIF